MRIYRNFIDPQSVIRLWPSCEKPLTPHRVPGVAREKQINDSKVMVVPVGGHSDFSWLEQKVMALFEDYAARFRYHVHGVVSMRCSEIAKGASLPWHADKYYNGDDDRILSMTIQIQQAELGGGLQFSDSGVVHLENGDAAIFDATSRHRSVRVVQGVRKIVTAFAGGVKQ